MCRPRISTANFCGVDDADLPSFADVGGERGVHLVYCAFDLLHLADWDVSELPLIERKALLEPMVANKPGLQFNGHDTGDGELILGRDPPVHPCDPSRWLRLRRARYIPDKIYQLNCSNLPRGDWTEAASKSEWSPS
jgi:hypothetical protein